MPDTEVSKELVNLVQTEINKQLKKTSVDDEHKNKEFISIDEINTHQDSCSCPDCPFCRSMNKRIEVIKDDNLISETIGRASKLINSKLSEKKKFSETIPIDLSDSKNIDYPLLRDIELTTSNDESFYRQTHIPFVKNYRRKQLKNIYDKDLALKGIVNNYVPRAIKFYEKQNNERFSISKQEKNILANEYLKNVLSDIKDGVT
jgi:hypothetical protein